MVNNLDHAKFMESAIKEARKGMLAGHGGPFGAVLVKDGKIIAKAHSQVDLDKDPTAHSEITLIKKACKKLKTDDLSGCVIYTTGYPCPMCMCACQWAKISAIYYGCDLTDTAMIGYGDQKFYNQKLQAFCVARPKCKELYKEYLNSKRK